MSYIGWLVIVTSALYIGVDVSAGTILLFDVIKIVGTDL